MYSRSSLFVIAIGFSLLIVLIAVLGFGAIRRADDIYRDMQWAQDSYSQTENFRRDISRDLYLADILLRDYLLDPSPESALQHRQELLTVRNSVQERLEQLSAQFPRTGNPSLARLHAVASQDSRRF